MTRRPDGLDREVVYLDYNATTPVDPAVVDAMLPYLAAEFGNPSSSHRYGAAPRAAVDDARMKLAALLDCEPDEIVFTASGSESDALAIRGVALAGGRRDGHVITSAIEHPAVAEACASLERLHGLRITRLAPDTAGRVKPAALEAAMTADTVLVSIMHANNETGTIQPVRELAEVAHARGVLFHTDAAQSVGKIRTSVRHLGVDLLTVAGHKMYAPKGIGALYVRDGVELEPVIGGGGQERGRRAGTENTAFIVALGAAAELAASSLGEEPARVRRLRDRLEAELTARLPGRVHPNGDRVERLPNTLNVSIDGSAGAELLAAIPALAAATGSTCHSGSAAPSSVLLAMGLDEQRAAGAIRLSLGRWTTEDDVRLASARLADAAAMPAARHTHRDASGDETPGIRTGDQRTPVHRASA